MKTKFMVAINGDFGVTCHYVASVGDGIKLLSGFSYHAIIVDASGCIVYRQ